jgi:hypothetical protein
MTSWGTWYGALTLNRGRLPTSSPISRPERGNFLKFLCTFFKICDIFTILFITVFARANHWTLASTILHPIPLKLIFDLKLSYLLRLGLPNDYFLLHFPSKFLYIFLSMCPAHLNLLIYNINYEASHCAVFSTGKQVIKFQNLFCCCNMMKCLKGGTDHEFFPVLLVFFPPEW